MGAIDEDDTLEGFLEAIPGFFQVDLQMVKIPKDLFPTHFVKSSSTH